MEYYVRSNSTRFLNLRTYYYQRFHCPASLHKHPLHCYDWLHPMVPVTGILFGLHIYSNVSNRQGQYDKRDMLFHISQFQVVTEHNHRSCWWLFLNKWYIPLRFHNFSGNSNWLDQFQNQSQRQPVVLLGMLLKIFKWPWNPEPGFCFRDWRFTNDFFETHHTLLKKVQVWGASFNLSFTDVTPVQYYEVSFMIFYYQ